jgi:hypothetical protein
MACTHLWMLLETCCLLSNTRFISFSIDHFKQIEGIVNPSRGKALYKFRFIINWLWFCNLISVFILALNRKAYWLVQPMQGLPLLRELQGPRV